jgi:hypothetical protein
MRQLVLAEPRQHVLVPGSRVVDERVAGEVRASVGTEPLARPFIERLAAGLEAYELAELLAASDVGLEPHRVFVTVERADVFAGAAARVAPADAVGTTPVLERALLDHSWITSFRVRDGMAGVCPHVRSSANGPRAARAAPGPARFAEVGGPAPGTLPRCREW